MINLNKTLTALRVFLVVAASVGVGAVSYAAPAPKTMTHFELLSRTTQHLQIAKRYTEELSTRSSRPARLNYREITNTLSKLIIQLQQTQESLHTY